MASPRIIIPHGLAADVLRVLDGQGWVTARWVASAVGGDFVEIRGKLDRMHAYVDTRLVDFSVGRQWRLRDEPAEVSGEVGCG